MAETARTTRPATAPAPAPQRRPSAPAAVVRAGVGAALSTTGPPAIRLAPVTAPPQPAGLTPEIQNLVRNPGSGASLPSHIQVALENSLGVPLDPVRVHTEERAAQVVDGSGARAFTYGLHIFLGSHESVADLELMAHEVTHVVQQQGRPVLQMSLRAGSADTFEQEAQQVSGAVQRGEHASVQGRTEGARVQGIWPVDEVVGWLEDRAWGLLNRYAPELAPIIRRGPEGVFDWLKDKVMSAFETVFNTLMAPVRAIAGAGQWLSRTFAPLVAWIQEAAAKIARNDCSPFREAAEKIEQVAVRIITPIVEKIRWVADKIGGFFRSIWEKVGAPVWDWLKGIAGSVWEKIKQFAGWVWDKTAPIRRILSRAWTWLKNKLGIGEGPEGQNGILQWVQGKIEAAWNWVKARIEPYKKQIMIALGVVGGILLLISPAGPILILGGIVYGVIRGVQWIRANWGRGNMIERARTYIERTLIPPLLGALNRMTAAVTRMAGAINGKLGEMAAGMGRMVSAVAGSILRFALAAVQWIAEQITALVEWGAQKLQALAQWIQTAFTRMIAFLQPILDFLRQLAGVILDIMSLPFVLVGRLWRLIPACIRDAVIDFVIPIILRQISIFRELVRDNDAWQRTRTDVMRLIRLVFVNHDLWGAIKAVFHLILRIFNVPVELAIQVARKAASAWDAVLASPIAFIKNAVRAIAHGFRLLWRRILYHLGYGVQGWLFGELADKGIHPPASWTDPLDLLNFALDVLGLSMNHVFELLAMRFDPVKIERLRVWYERIRTAWQWIQEIIDPSRSPADVARGLVDKAKDFGKSILEGVVEWIAGRVATELAVMATAAAASAGLSEVLDTARRIYRAIQTAVRVMRRVLEMVNRVLDGILEIVSGNIEAAGVRIEDAMHRAMPIVITFLADQVGLGDIGEEIREVVDTLRAKVDQAILWVIDKVKAMIEAIIGAVKAGVQALLEWWKERRNFKGEDGENHSIYFTGNEENAELYIESQRQSYRIFIANLKIDDKDTRLVNASKKALQILDEIDALRKQPKVDTPEGKLQSKKIIDKLNELADQTKILVGASGGIPLSVIRYGSLGTDGRGTEMHAEILSSKNAEGSRPEEFPTIWLKANRRPKLFVQGHLLNQRLGGPGRAYNLTPISRSANARHERDAESDIKAAVNRKKVVSYLVRPIYEGHDELDGTIKNARDRLQLIAVNPQSSKKQKEDLEKKIEYMTYEQKNLATSFYIEWAILKFSNGKWVDDEVKPPVQIDNILPEE